MSQTEKGSRSIVKGGEVMIDIECGITSDPKSVGLGIHPVFKVPQKLRDLQQETYNPKIVRLGIYHLDMHPRLSELWESKVTALRTTAKRLSITTNNLVEEIEAFDPEIRECYGDNTDNLSKEILASNFAMDSCFILEFFRSRYCWFLDPNIDKEIMSDIFKLENQIPLFILLRILELEFMNPHEVLVDLLCSRRQVKMLPFSLKPIELRNFQAEIEANIKEGACHLLHLLNKTYATFLRPSNIPTDDSDTVTYMDIINDWTDFMSTVVDKDGDIVHEFLIRFKPSKDGQVRFKKGWFGSAVVYLPQICLVEEIESLFWNMIAFAVGSDNIIGNLIFFMKRIIRSKSKSVALLTKPQIINSTKSNEELDAMFNNFSNEISESCGPFEIVWSQVIEHCSSSSNKWKLWFTCLLFRFVIIGLCLLFLFRIIGYVIKWYA